MRLGCNDCADVRAQRAAVWQVCRTVFVRFRLAVQQSEGQFKCQSQCVSLAKAQPSTCQKKNALPFVCGGQIWASIISVRCAENCSRTGTVRHSCPSTRTHVVCASRHHRLSHQPAATHWVGPLRPPNCTIPPPTPRDAAQAAAATPISSHSSRHGATRALALPVGPPS